MYWLFDALAAGRPSVAVVANGGGITLTEVELKVRARRPIYLIEGSGRAGRARLAAAKDAGVGPDIVGLRERAEKAGLTRRPELFTIVPLQGGAPSLRDAIGAAIRGK